MIEMKMPFGPYDVVLADPPWRFRNFRRSGIIGNWRGTAQKHYATMELPDICALPVSDMLADEAVLFLWAVGAQLPEAFQVMEAWGFEYKSQRIWVKPHIGVGHWVRNRHENLLIGTRGGMSPPAPSVRPDSVIEAPRNEHSAKPPLVHDEIEKMFPAARRIELFARECKKGWDVWGLQAPTYPTRML